MAPFGKVMYISESISDSVNANSTSNPSISQLSQVHDDAEGYIFRCGSVCLVVVNALDLGVAAGYKTDSVF